MTEIDAKQLTGFVLAGGRSSRMGADKSTLALGGTTLLEIATEKLAAICSEVRVGGRIGGVADVHKGRGAPGGVQSILAACETDFALVLAVDLPFVSFAFLQELLTSVTDEFDAVVPVQPDGTPQPLCAVFRTATCLPVFSAALETSEETPSMRMILKSLRVRFVDATALGANSDTFLNVNTPDDLELARTLADARNAA